jgi:N-acyl homoserine lactone hydrolase
VNFGAAPRVVSGSSAAPKPEKPRREVILALWCHLVKSPKNASASMNPATQRRERRALKLPLSLNRECLGVDRRWEMIYMRLAICLTGRLLLAATLCGLPLGPSVGAANLAPAPKVASLRLYVFDCGTLVYNKPEDYNLKREEVKDTNMGVTCYLVVHPKGTLIYDTGLNDRLVGRPLYENVLDGYGQIKFNTLSGQLADIGVRSTNIDYLVLSHYHWDHIGNAGEFAGSTWLVYKGDRDHMFSSASRADPWFSQYSALERSKTVLLNGDYDVFGDGTVVVLATPGHTEGHCSLWVRLKNTGPVVLSGDLYHYAEERDLKRMPEEEKTKGTVESRQKVEELLRRTGAQLWIGHSMEFFRTVRKSPAWYD